MKSAAGKLFWVAIWFVFLGANLSREWDSFIADHPGASVGDFVRASGPFLGQLILGIVGFIVLIKVVALVAKPVARWTAPPQSPPPPLDAGPLYALRTFPLHVSFCVGLIALNLVTFYAWPTAAMVLIGPTIGSWVLLARRMGFEPSNDPAAPHIESRT